MLTYTTNATTSLQSDREERIRYRRQDLSLNEDKLTAISKREFRRLPCNIGDTMPMLSDHSACNPFAFRHTAYAACRYSTSDFQLNDFERYGIARPVWIAKAKPNRAAEYLAGRYCAQQALAQLRPNQAQITAHADRSPIWPLNICGAITHHDGFSAALVGTTIEQQAIGIDGERVFDSRNKPRLEAKLLTAAERALVNRQAGNRAQLVSSIFSAKESIFKALYPLRKEYIHFHDYECTSITAQQLDFSASKNHRRAHRSHLELSVAYIIENDRVMTAIQLPPRPDNSQIGTTTQQAQAMTRECPQ